MEQVRFPTGAANIIRETEKAILLNSGLNQVWLPKSQITIHIPHVAEIGYIEMPYWLYKKNFGHLQ